MYSGGKRPKRLWASSRLSSSFGYFLFVFSATFYRHSGGKGLNRQWPSSRLSTSVSITFIKVVAPDRSVSSRTLKDKENALKKMAHTFIRTIFSLFHNTLKKISIYIWANSFLLA